MRLTAILIAAVVVLAAVAVSLFVLDEFPAYRYYVAVPNTGTSLSVVLEIDNPVFSKTGVVSLYEGDKQIRVTGCADAAGRPAGKPYTDSGMLFITVGRGSRTLVSYTAGIAALGKHGNRGDITGDYAVFDGDEALLLPYSAYDYKPGSDRKVLMGGIGFSFDLPPGWKQIIPRSDVKNPRWADIYGITQDAFVFGKFTKVSGTSPGLSAFALASGDVPSRETVDGFNSLYAYYANLFGSAPDLYNIVALPKPGPDTPQVIGGAGKGSVAASFDPDLLRDWQLLAHRMFHAFFDTAAPYAALHIAPNTWFNEGLATYYENMSMGALPDSLRRRVGADPNRQFALLFDCYLYMRTKDPLVYNYPPMREDELPSEGAREFMHYTTAPLLVKLLGDQALGNGAQPDAALKYCVANGAKFDERFVAFDTATALLGADAGQKFCETYLLNAGVPPLWNLKPYQPPDEDVLAALNGIEYVQGTWFKLDDPNYHTDTVTMDDLRAAEASLSNEPAAFVMPGMKSSLMDYSMPVYALLNDYYYHAKQKGISYDDPELRKKMFAGATDAGQ